MKKTLLYILISLLSLPVLGDNSSLSFKRLDTKNGLPNNIIFSLYSDKDHFIWFGTDYGLTRYDGYEFKTFQSEVGDPTSIAGNTIFDIGEDHHQNLWICSNEGVDIYNRDYNKFDHVAFEDPVDQLVYFKASRNFFQDSHQNIFIVTDDEVYRYDTLSKNLDLLHIPDPIYKTFRKEYKQFAYIDSRDRIWMAAKNFNQGLLCYDFRKDSLISNPYTTNIFNITDKPYAIAEQENGNIWIGTNRGISVIVADLSSTYNIPLGDVIVYSIFFDDNNKVWIGTEPEGLYCYNLTTKTLSQYNNNPNDANSIGSNSILTATIDKLGILWTGSTQAGVSYTNIASTKKFENISKKFGDENSLISNTVACIYQDSDSNFWIGTDGGGLDYYNPKTNTFAHYVANQSGNTIGSNSVLTIAEDSQGKIWAGGYLMGVNCIDKNSGEITIYKHQTENPNSLSNDDVRDIYIDDDGIIWVATCGGGLNRFNPKTETFKIYEQEDGIISSWCLKLFEDSKGLLWIGTYNGISILDKITATTKNYSSINSENGLSHDWIYDINEDDSGRIWVATSKGLNSFDRKTEKFTPFFINDGLPSNCINGLQIDKNNDLWLSTTNGISHYIVSEHRFKNFSMSDGLTDDQFFRSSSYQSPSGKIYFGSYSGVTSFYPDSIADDNTFLPVYLTDLLIFHTIVNPGDPEFDLEKHISQSKKITLSHKHNVFTIKFAAPYFIGSDKIEYAYILDGFSKNWEILGQRNEVTFTNLDPGLYTFRIKASNADGLWNDDPTSLDIEIIPPFWHTWWFKVFVVFLIVILIISLYLYRVRSITQQNKLLENIVEKRTSEITEKNKILTDQQDKLQSTNQLLEEKQEEIISQNEELEMHRNSLEKLVEDRTEKLQKALVKAKESDRLKSTFLANMSHEIRTPMNSIIGFSSLLKEDDFSDDEKSDFIHLIEEHSNMLLKIIDDILDLSLIEANQLKFNNQPFLLNDIIDDLYSTYTLGNKNEDVQIIVQNKESEKNLKLYADPFRIKQIISNLIDNAIKFTKKGHIEIGVFSDHKNINIYVKDTGSGISPDGIKHIFKRFTKDEDKEKMYIQGAGLGLSIAQRIANSLEGKIVVESEQGKGSCFTFQMPVKSIITDGPVKTEQSKTGQINKDWKEKTILIVEDEEANYLFLEKALKKTQSHIIWARNGEEGMQIFSNTSDIDIILMDIKMPVMDGIEATKKIKSRRPTQIVIAQTAYATNEDKIRFKDAKFDYYLSKPINPKRLIAVLEKFL